MAEKIKEKTMKSNGHKRNNGVMKSIGVRWNLEDNESETLTTSTSTSNLHPVVDLSTALTNVNTNKNINTNTDISTNTNPISIPASTAAVSTTVSMKNHIPNNSNNNNNNNNSTTNNNTAMISNALSPSMIAEGKANATIVMDDLTFIIKESYPSCPSHQIHTIDIPKSMLSKSSSLPLPSLSSSSSSSLPLPSLSSSSSSSLLASSSSSSSSSNLSSSSIFSSSSSSSSIILSSDLHPIKVENNPKMTENENSKTGITDLVLTQISLFSEIQVVPPDPSGNVTLRVVFDGINRAACEFKIKAPSINYSDSSINRSNQYGNINDNIDDNNNSINDSNDNDDDDNKILKLEDDQSSKLNFEDSSGNANYSNEEGERKEEDNEEGRREREGEDVFIEWKENHLIHAEPININDNIINNRNNNKSISDSSNNISNNININDIKYDNKNKTDGSFDFNVEKEEKQFSDGVTEKINYNKTFLKDATELIFFESVNIEDSVFLSDKIIRPSIEDDVICRMIHIDQLTYKAVIKAAGKRMKNILQSGMKERINQKLKEKESWNMIESLYLRQKIWRRIATTVSKGMNDRTSDFNINIIENIPASWILKVDGRPKINMEDEEKEKEKEKENEEDAVCMCCFDGSSFDGNRIMFCDGCNAAVHQACYGVIEIPDGDFFCDRCRAIQILADKKEERNLNGREREREKKIDDNDNDDDIDNNNSNSNDKNNDNNTDIDIFDIDNIKDAIKCCLCPMYHGGFKATTDGRWIHLCCALWSQKSIIVDINEMSPIDIVNVEVQEYTDFEEEEEKEKKEEKDKDNIEFDIIQRQPIIQELSVIFPITPKEEIKEILPSILNSITIPANKQLNDEILKACMYCGAFGGYVVRCRGSHKSHYSSNTNNIYSEGEGEGTGEGIDEGRNNNDEKNKERGELCDAVFHPLCAWFQGVYVRTSITDPTFQGKDRKGMYPSGLSYEFYCNEHCPEESKGHLFYCFSSSFFLLSTLLSFLPYLTHFFFSSFVPYFTHFFFLSFFPSFITFFIHFFMCLLTSFIFSFLSFFLSFFPSSFPSSLRSFVSLRICFLFLISYRALIFFSSSKNSILLNIYSHRRHS